MTTGEEEKIEPPPGREKNPAAVALGKLGASKGGKARARKFTGKERDAETGLDYFPARYYSPLPGRFTSPDEFSGGPGELFVFVDAAAANPTFYAEITEPQTLNKYQYCLNSPLRYVDADGHQQKETLKAQGARSYSVKA